MIWPTVASGAAPGRDWGRARDGKGGAHQRAGRTEPQAARGLPDAARSRRLAPSRSTVGHCGELPSRRCRPTPPRLRAAAAFDPCVLRSTPGRARILAVAPARRQRTKATANTPEVTMPARPKAVLGRRPPPLSLGRWGARRVATGRGAVAPSPLGRGGGGGPRRGFGGRRLVAPLTSAAALERRDGGDGTAGSQEPPAASSRRSRRTLPSSLRSSARRAGARSGRPIASPAACSRRREEWGAASKAARSRACDSPAVRLTVAVLYPCWAGVLLESLVALAPVVSARRTARRGDR